MSNSFLVRNRTENEGRSIHDVEDGLEAACRAYPDLNLEVLDVDGDKTFVADHENDVMYVVTRLT